MITKAYIGALNNEYHPRNLRTFLVLGLSTFFPILVSSAQEKNLHKNFTGRLLLNKFIKTDLPLLMTASINYTARYRLSTPEQKAMLFPLLDQEQIGRKQRQIKQ
jgi:hypothetical protein